MHLNTYREEAFQSLTLGEWTTLNMLADGFVVREIARERCLAESTIRSQVKNILTKFDVKSQGQAIVLFYKRELVRIKNNIEAPS